MQSFNNNNWLCDECKALGFCKLEQIRKMLNDKLHGLPKLFTFNDFAKNVPLQPFSGYLGNYTNKHLQMACDAFHQEDYETALLHFKAALEGRANISYAHFGIALCYFKINNFEMALIHIEYNNRGSKMVEYFITLCEIGLKEVVLNQQHQLLHPAEPLTNNTKYNFAVNAFV